jgi:2-amino-4-hydroxy-6-hydroxymethyldihydropteridine diphosphokinase
LVQAIPGVDRLRTSACHATKPIGGPPGQGDFLNAAARLETTLSPRELLAALQKIEHKLGRKRTRRWEARPIDLDLLLYGDLCLRETSPPAPLEIPHPRMAFRRFVLEPAAEVAADMVHPKIGWTIQELRDHLVNAPPYIAIAAADQEFAARLAYVAAFEVQGGIVPLQDQSRAPFQLPMFLAPSEDPPDSMRPPPVEYPKLLVICDAPPPLPYSGPVLDVSGMDFETALEELVTAVRAMKK